MLTTRGVADKAAINRPIRFSLSVLCPLLLILGHLHLVSAVLTTCYDPSGNVRADVPCRQDAVASACCGQGWVCTNTSLCIAGPEAALNPGDPAQFEGTCTDKTWNSPHCPSFCRTNGLEKNGANGVFNCTGGNYCCAGSDSDCCLNDSEVFFLGAFANITTIGGNIGSGFFTTTSSSSTATSLPATTTTTTKSASSKSTASNTSNSPNTPTTPATSAAPTTPPSAHSSGLGSGAKAGIGVGVAVLAIALAVGGYFLYRHMQKSKPEPVQYYPFPQAEYYKPPDAAVYDPQATEMYAGHERSEMGTSRERTELPAGR